MKLLGFGAVAALAMPLKFLRRHDPAATPAFDDSMFNHLDAMGYRMFPAELHPEPVDASGRIRVVSVICEEKQNLSLTGTALA